ncbi:TetR/AcrR family transcriptional regulator [Halosegnis longus]|uniref:TetR/AcrR family transcriptional regulator n=1 Tax=Halosegnis longus TaxID=2216012 RepID=UPI00129EDD5F|nr:TetR/AcrR family transcriptional regulator [Halosegnis longus]
MSGDPDSREQIMQAAFEALATHGYADLTVARIADEFTKSKSLLYYHYDGKDDILRSLLDYATDQFLATLDAESTDDPAANLREFVDQLLPESPSEDALTGRRVILELRGEAVGNPDFRATFTAMDDRLRDRVTAEIEAGVERGRFAVADPETAATDLTMLLNGALLESATTDHDITEQARATLHARIDALAEGVDE